MAKEKNAGNHMPQLAYHNRRFLESADARTLRILAEYLDPQAHFRKAGALDTVVFFGSARIHSREVAVRRLRELIAK